jgi:DNA-binding transcriptional ArsR family regulator
MLSRDYVLAPQVVQVEFALAPACNMLESMGLLTEIERLSGLSDWVIQTAAKLSPEMLWRTRLVSDAFFSIFFHCSSPADYDDFSHYLSDLAARSPFELTESLWEKFATAPTTYPECWKQDKPAPIREELMHSREVFVDFMNIIHEHQDDALWSEAYDLLQDPPRLLAFIVEHVQMMYDEYLKPEWDRILPMLQESVAAFQKLDYSNLTVYEAIRAVTGRDMSSKNDIKILDVERMVFVPGAHIGPYVGKFVRDNTLYVLFGARLPRGVHSPSSDLSRAELLIRLNALADDSRLRILELLTHHDELCAQDIIELLGLSQPTVSRHLSQLSATGYITERRREISKCYSLNTDRVMDTLRSLTNFLSRQ